MLDSIYNLIDNEMFFFIGLTVILITAFIMTKQISILDNIQSYSIQSFCIFLMNLGLLKNHLSTHLLLTAIIIFCFKVIALPFFLKTIVKKLHVDDQFENLVNIQVLFVILGLISGLCFFVFPYSRLSAMSPSLLHAIPIAVTMVLSGLMLMINRRKTISQIMGFLVMENGITLLLLFSAKSLSIILEIALVIDLLIGVLIMGIFSNRIKTNFEDYKIDTNHNEKESI